MSQMDDARAASNWSAGFPDHIPGLLRWKIDVPVIKAFVLKIYNSGLKAKENLKIWNPVLTQPKTHEHLNINKAVYYKNETSKFYLQQMPL